MLGGLLEQSIDELRERAWRLDAVGTHRPVGFLDDLLEGREGHGRLERTLARGHFVEQNAQGEEVRSRIEV